MPEIDTAAIYAQLQRDWKGNLSRWGVPALPEWNPEKPNARLLQLIYLRHHMGEAVDKSALSLFVRSVMPTASTDQQARHWKRDGWNVQGRGGNDAKGQPLKSSEYCLASLQPSPEFMAQRTRDLGRVAACDWESLVAVYSNRCGCCGAGGVKLEQGHMDPRKPLTLQNTIPLCEECNRWQLDRFVLNEKGKVATVLPAARNAALFADLDSRERRALAELLSPSPVA
jgi:hypothetical protein